MSERDSFLGVPRERCREHSVIVTGGDGTQEVLAAGKYHPD